mgnify:CR=1 FL=1
MEAFPAATASAQAELFGPVVSAASIQDGSPTYRDDSATVTLVRAATGEPASEQVGAGGVCFAIEIPGAAASGCVERGLIATGLAYGAFQDGDGPIELVGIVPDDVTVIELDGQTITPASNVWHYSSRSGRPLAITVRSADGRTAFTAS